MNKSGEEENTITAITRYEYICFFLQKQECARYIFIHSQISKTFISLISRLNEKYINRIFRWTGRLNHLPYLLSISVSMSVIKDFFNQLYEGSSGLNQAYMLL